MSTRDGLTYGTRRLADGWTVTWGRRVLERYASRKAAALRAAKLNALPPVRQCEHGTDLLPHESRWRECGTCRENSLAHY